MKIKNELLTIAATVPGIASSTYQSDFEANFNNTIDPVNTIRFPFLQFQDIKVGSLDLNPANGVYKETWNIAIYITTPTDFDANTNENQELIETIVAPLIREMIGAINKTKKFELISKVALSTHHYKYNYWVTGQMALFSLTEKVGAPIC